MELKEFISTVLVSLVRGVEEAQNQLADSEGIINPLGLKAKIALGELKETPEFTNVEFEVALEVESKGESSGGAGVKVAVFEMGASGKQQNTESHASKLRFSVPVHLPPGKLIKPEP